MTPITITPPGQPPTNLLPVTSGAPIHVGLTPHRWTIAEYRELYKTGLFSDKKTMLLNGEIYVMTMPGPLHNTVMTLTFGWLWSICPVGHYVRNQQGFDVGVQNDPGPDLAVVLGDPNDHDTHNPTTAALIIEVSDSTLFLDTTTKAELYATAGVADYWLVDLQNRRLLVFRDPEPLPAGLGATAYRTHFSLNPTETIAPLAFLNATVQVAKLLPRS